MSMLEKRDANNASGCLITKPGDKNKFLHTHTETRKERLKNNCWKVRQCSFSVYKLMWYMWGCVNTVFIEGIFLSDGVSVLWKYLLMNCIKTPFHLQAVPGNANMVEAPCLDSSHESMCELQPAAPQGSPGASAAQEKSTRAALGSSMVWGFVSRSMALPGSVRSSGLHRHWCGHECVMWSCTTTDRVISHRSYPIDGFNIPVSSHPCLISSQSLVPTHRSCCVSLPTCSKRERKAAGNLCTSQAQGSCHNSLWHLYCRYPWAILGAGAPAPEPASLSQIRSTVHWWELLPSVVNLLRLDHSGQHKHRVGTTLYFWFRRVPGHSPEDVDLHGPGLRAG